MSSAKSRNFRRRAGDDDDDTTTNTTPSTTTTATKLAASNKPKISTPKSLLSFADDDDSPSPAARAPPPKPSSVSRLSNSASSSAHKHSSSKDRVKSRPTSTSTSTSTPTPSNILPQAGLYTKESLLELKKNTRNFTGSKTSHDSEPVVVLKGLVKPVVVEDATNERSRDVEENEGGKKSLNVERNDALARLRKVGLGKDEEEEEGGIPDKAMIEAIRAKRERLRQAKAAAPDYIALDGGSNHGAAEGLSDEEPEFRGRIGLLGEKGGSSDKKGVFEAFEERAMARESKIGSDIEDEDEEDKLWEEEQVRKGLGKRLDDGVGSQGASGGVVGGASVRQSGPAPSFGYSGSGTSGVQYPVQDVGSISAGGLFAGNLVSIPQQAELAKKALFENLRRLKESHARTMLSLAKTEENLSSSLMNVTTLESSLSAADEKFLFMQRLRDFVSAICAFLQYRAPEIEELEDHNKELHEQRARAIAERRAVDNAEEMDEIEPAIIAARAEFRKGGSNMAKVAAAAAAAAQSASPDASASKSMPVELDELGRDMNLQKRLDIKRRAEARKRRRAKADSKRKVSIENDDSFQRMEGELSTDESDSETAAYESNRDQLLQAPEVIFRDAAEEYTQFSMVIERFEKWKKDYASSYRDAYMSLSIPAIFSPYVRLELLKWDPLHEEADFIDMKWHSLLFDYGLPDDESSTSGNDTETDADANLIPDLVEKVAIPILHHQLENCWDMLSTRQTKYAVAAVKLVVRYVNLSSSDSGDKLVKLIRDRLTHAVANLMVPTWSLLEMKAVPNAARISAYRFGRCVRLMRNICLWNEILAMSVLENIALDDLLCDKILPHLHNIHSNTHDAVTRTERVIAAVNGVWAGPSVTGDRSRKLQPLVDYLLLIGKTLERKYVAGALELESGTLVRRLKKMLVELNEYDHARALARTFNLKEAL